MLNVHIEDRDSLTFTNCLAQGSRTGTITPSLKEGVCPGHFTRVGGSDGGLLRWGCVQLWGMSKRHSCRAIPGEGSEVLGHRGTGAADRVQAVQVQSTCA